MSCRDDELERLKLRRVELQRFGSVRFFSISTMRNKTKMSAAHNVLDYYPPTPQLQLLQVVPFNITMAIYLKKNGK